MVVAHPASEVTFFTSLIANFTKPRCQVGGFFHTSTVRSHERIITHHLVDHDWPDSQTRIATSTGMEYALCNIWYEDTTNNINILQLKLFQLSTTANHLESTSQVLKVYCLICHLSHVLIYLLTEDAYEKVYKRSSKKTPIPSTLQAIQLVPPCGKKPGFTSCMMFINSCINITV